MLTQLHSYLRQALAPTEVASTTIDNCMGSANGMQKGPLVIEEPSKAIRTMVIAGIAAPPLRSTVADMRLEE